MAVSGRQANVDFARGIGMLCISYNHIFAALGNYEHVDILFKYFYSFELAIFFIASGYIQHDKTDPGFKEYCKHAASTLLYPWLTFTVLILLTNGALQILRYGFAAYISGLPLTLARAVTWGEGANWFLLTFFVVRLLVYPCRRQNAIPRWAVLAISVVLGSLMCAVAEKYSEPEYIAMSVTPETIAAPAFWLWHLWSLIARSIVGASLIMIGVEIKAHMPETVNGRSYGFACALLAVGIAAALLNRGYVDLHFAFIRNPVLFYVGAICTPTALLIIGHAFHPEWLMWCGRESILLILWQLGFGYMAAAVNRLLPAVGASHVACIVCSVIILCAGLVISRLSVWVIRHSFLKILIAPPEHRGR